VTESGLAARAASSTIRRMSTTTAPHAAGRIWYVLGGIVCILVGFFAIGRPGLAALAITQIIGAFILVSGAFLLFAALFGKARQHRFLDFVSAVLRLLVGVLIMGNLIKGLLALTLLLAAVFVVEGIYSTVLGLKLRGKNSAWVWMLLNGVAALVLGFMLFAKFPSDAPWAVGLLFGINSIFTGVSLLAFGAALPRATEA
jgi:uncharacterized membrane protein HdeD (DUF308 family)